MNGRKARKEKRVCSIGGQAVLEGVMMRGERSVATAVRSPSGEITIESSRFTPLKEKNIFYRLPFFRGVFNLFSQLFQGTAILLRSAEVYGDFEEPTKFEKFLAKKLKINPKSLMMGLSVVLGVALAVALFMLLPNFLAGLIFSIPEIADTHIALQSLTEGAIMLLIFILYVLFTNAFKELRRLYRYHGAEHKVISCYEAGLELTVENARGMKTAHPRCGTTFTFIVLCASILVFALINWALKEIGILKYSSLVNSFIKLPVKLVFVPIIAGISYEILKFLARFDNPFVKLLRAPGMLLQKLTTKEPDDEMIEVAIAAFKKVMEMDSDPSVPETKFKISVPYDVARNKIAKKVKEESDIDWLFCEILNVKRSSLNAIKSIEWEKFEKIDKLADEIEKGKPLQYVLGYTEFYGYKISVNKNVLIPRPETELLCEEAIKRSKGKSVLELCTGSGAAAIAIKLGGAREVIATDISPQAIEVAKANALLNGAGIKFVVSDMFEGVEGKYDVIVCNPPYIPSKDIENLDREVKEHEPRLALDGGEDGLKFYRIIADRYKDYLNPGGCVLLEVGIGQAEEVVKIFNCGEILKDYASIDRIIIING
ncbi:MAG: peptide chain release factor N(5)-glutamine methyltransferase [Clostridiales bacterium]|nr:peptide chain release factor N(5)-glutamine methyltransferase [Clostridiales bacterium]